MRRAIIAPAVAALVLGATPALAAPPKRQTFELVCNNGQALVTEVHGNGAFTPGRLVGSPRVLTPFSSGDSAFQAELPADTVIS